jgi:hypothetical protein
VRSEIFPALTPELIEGFVTREIIEMLQQMRQAGVQVTFSGLEGRLNGAAQSLLHGVVAADDMDDGESCLEQARACLRSLEGSLRKRRADELRSRVKVAEREGRVQEALAWMAELGRLEKETRTADGI